MVKTRRLISGLAGAMFLAAAAPALAAPPPMMIQYFEAKWDVIRYRMTDVFMAGYDSAWLPPPSKGMSATDVGYAVLDRFDLGSSSSQTRYGTENTFRLMVDQFHRAGCQVYVDWIMNHNGASDNDTTGFLAAGGYPGFVLETGSDPDGDFHAYQPNGSGGCTHPDGCPQSISPCCGFPLSNPSCPGCSYHLYDGRLLGLIDIDQAKNHLYIRHPIMAGDPNNIPPGSQRNLPNIANKRLYPDRDAAGTMINNPGTSRNPGAFNTTVYPYNLAAPTLGDAITENASSLLLRSTQYYTDVLKVDGFRLDAAKHVPSWFWDNLWDSIVYNRVKGFDGVYRPAYSFSESVESNSNTLNWVRKPGGATGWPASGYAFGNRDALDLNGAGQLRDIVSANGGGSWDNVLNNMIDLADDGFQNGSVGVRHVSSHDNAVANGENDTVSHAMMLMLPGPAIVYHMALQFGNPPNNFPRRNGRDDALGLGDNYITRLLKIRSQYARGWYIPINSTDSVNPSQADILAYTRRTPSSVDNLLVAVSDLESNGYDVRNFATAFPAGTRLHELTGNAADPVVDPNGNIPERLVVDGSGRLANADNPGDLYLKIPRNRNANGVFHGRGYVMYGPAVPGGTLSIVNATSSVAAPDVPATPDYNQRVNPVTMITSSTFDIQLQTTQADLLDPNTDDLAVYRIDSGFTDTNANGSTYMGQPSSDFNAGNTSSDSPSYGFENFLTQNSPRCAPDMSGNCQNTGTGTYRQTIDAAALGEGYHYITVRAYRHRTVGDPLFAEFRMVVYVDVADPDFTLLAPTNNCNNDIPAVPYDIVAKTTDTTSGKVYVYVDLPAGTDFIGLSTGGANLAAQNGDTWTLRLSSLITGNHRIDVVAIETLPNGVNKVRHRTYAGVQSFTGTAAGPGDIDANGRYDGFDIEPFTQYILGINPTFGPAADMNCDGLIDLDDVQPFADRLVQP